MAERSFAPATGQAYKPQNLYMRLLMAQLNRKKSLTKEDAKFAFAIYKGEEEFDKTKEIPISSSVNGTIPLNQISMDFVVINYNPHSKYVFSVMMSNIKEKLIQQIGQFVLSVNKYIDEYLLSESKVFHQTVIVNEEFQADFQLYIENSQYGLQRLIRDIKNPKPKNQNQVENPKASNQKITQLRRKMDNEEDNHENTHKEQKFKRFSPKKDAHEEKNKKAEYLNNKRKQEQQKKAQQEQQNLRVKKQQEEEEKKKKNKQFVPKKQWIIPQAQKFLNQSKAKQKQLKRKYSKESENETKPQHKNKSEDGKQVKKSRQKPKVEDEKLIENLPLGPKILFAVLFVTILVLGSYFVFRADQQETQKAIPIFPNPKNQKKAKGSTKNRKK